ncbi:[FeFe] hydrogenase H-cluster maturation GTPase HydF [Caldanaerobius polysaccharolyticus]|uniref:[FeFe] hydrogenase H-cluster maturation GTPase HydF n=1 Tax=Caldanaerobius polysaccharolyticus TaxID=44256 RepID=UPI00047C4228|nr:[FeFe] hydrogenase H-cluster maturation GTPase HydF [Caldanaerobius polysaccharolyticus]
MNTTPKSERLHIAVFGRRNAGKSSIINALTNQSVSLVSDVAGTTTDPVYKSMELLPIGPVLFIDTAGVDDVGELGQMRVKKTYEVLNKTDLALLVVDSSQGMEEYEKDILNRIKEKKIPVVGVVNKADLCEVPESEIQLWEKEWGIKFVKVSALSKRGISDLKRAIVVNAPYEDREMTIVGDLVRDGQIAVLVVPIDKAAPKGRLILPQQQVIRDILDHDAIAVVTKEHELKQTLDSLGRKPALVITDSQAFLKVDADTPKDIPMTSFSILFARYKGDLNQLVAGAKAIEGLKPGDKVLIAEACTHHRQADDIATVKIPRWLRQLVGGDLEFSWASGGDFPEDLEEYKLIVHCGGCMINRREMMYRLSVAAEKGVPIVNYGVLIAYVLGVLDRALDPFPLAKMTFHGLV